MGDTNATVGPYNRNNTLNATFRVDKGGYVITLRSGAIKKMYIEAQ
jgi:hypothetical protein